MNVARPCGFPEHHSTKCRLAACCCALGVADPASSSLPVIMTANTLTTPTTLLSTTPTTSTKILTTIHCCGCRHHTCMRLYRPGVQFKALPVGGVPLRIIVNLFGILLTTSEYFAERWKGSSCACVVCLTCLSFSSGKKFYLHLA